MVSGSVYETYLYLSKKKFAIQVIQVENIKIIYEKEILLENNSNQLKLEDLQNFLDNNILKIEKILKQFVKDVFVILNSDEFFSVLLSIKNNNNGKTLSLEDLSYSLNEARDQCKKTTEQKKIVHMLIKNYHIGNKDYSSLPENIKCDNFSLDIKFICLSNNLIKSLEKSFKRYHISINQIISADYVENFFNDNSDIFKKTRKIIQGCNRNEVNFFSKKKKNKGFFEKFFNFFN